MPDTRSRRSDCLRLSRSRCGRRIGHRFRDGGEPLRRADFWVSVQVRKQFYSREFWPEASGTVPRFYLMAWVRDPHTKELQKLTLNADRRSRTHKVRAAGSCSVMAGCHC